MVDLKLILELKPLPVSTGLLICPASLFRISADSLFPFTGNGKNDHHNSRNKSH